MILEDIELTRNALAVEAKVRPATIHDLYNGDTKRIELPTIQRILDAINQEARNKGKSKTYTLDDLIKYSYEKDGQ
jgi:predicted transcriptional regulator